MSKENQNNAEEKVSFKTKVSLGFSSGINAIDSKTNPIVGKYLYVIFKWLTLAILFVVLPLFVLLFQFGATEDGYVFSYDTVVAGDTDASGVATFLVNDTVSVSYDYDTIDDSIDLIYQNKIVDSIFSLQDDATNMYFFYGVFVNDYNDWAIEATTPTLESYVVASEEWWTTVSTSPDQKALFGEWLAAKTTTDDDDSAATYVNDSALAKKAFREIYKPVSFTNSNEDILNIGLITGWTLVGVGILISILWFWFSKFSEVPLSEKTKAKREDKD